MRNNEAGPGRKFLSWCYLLAERGPFTRFLLFGAWNTVWTFGLYAFLLVACELNYLLALSITWMIGLAVSYVANFLWVFRTDSRLRIRINFRRYLILLGSTFVMNLMLLSLLTDVAQVRPLLAQFIVLPAIVLMNFWGGRLWAFRAQE